jgi:hypothetical protein
VIEALHQDERVKNFVLGRGDDQFKKEWNPTVVEHLGLEAYPKTFFFAVYALIHLRLWPWAKSLKTVKYLKGLLEKTEKDVSTLKLKMFSSEKTCLLVKEIGPASLLRDGKKRQTVRVANYDDLFKLTVAMKARNTGVVLDKLKSNEVCIVDEANQGIKRYCWLTQDIGNLLECESRPTSWLESARSVIKEGCFFICDHNLTTQTEVELLINQAASLASLPAKVNRIGVLTKISSAKKWERVGYRLVCSFPHTTFFGLDHLGANRTPS